MMITLNKGICNNININMIILRIAVSICYYESGNNIISYVMPTPLMEVGVSIRRQRRLSKIQFFEATFRKLIPLAPYHDNYRQFGIVPPSSIFHTFMLISNTVRFILCVRSSVDENMVIYILIYICKLFLDYAFALRVWYFSFFYTFF